MDFETIFLDIKIFFELGFETIFSCVRFTGPEALASPATRWMVWRIKSCQKATGQNK